MYDLIDQTYCSQQIFIPPNLPLILKKYAKAAIRTQPGDLLVWSTAYFRALAEGIPPPVKERIEFPQYDTPSGLTNGFIKVLLQQIGKGEVVPTSVLVERWTGVCLNPTALQDLLEVGMFENDVNWLEFVAICAGTIQPSLTKTMISLCELLTDEPEGGRATIPFTLFLNLYKFLADLDCGPVNTREQHESNILKDDSEVSCTKGEISPTEVQEEEAAADIDWTNAIDSEKEITAKSQVENSERKSTILPLNDLNGIDNPEEHALRKVESNSKDEASENVKEEAYKRLENYEATEETAIAVNEAQSEKIKLNTIEEPAERNSENESINERGENNCEIRGTNTSLNAKITSIDDEPPSSKEDGNTESNGQIAKVDESQADDVEGHGNQMESIVQLQIQPYYIVDDDGTLSAPNIENEINSEMLQDRDSDKSAITNLSEEGLMVWPDVKEEEKEELQFVQSIEHEVTSEAGIEVFTDVEAQQQEELKLLSEQSEVKPEVLEKEGNIFAPEIESFVEFLEVESAPVEDEVDEFHNGSKDDSQIAVEKSNQDSKMVSEIEEISSEMETEGYEESLKQEPLEPDACVDASDERKLRTKQEGDIDILVKKDSEMMLLPTPTTSDIMLYVENNCEVTSKKISPSQVLTDKMSLFDIQVGVPVNETVEEELEQPRYPKWMNIPGIGPIIPKPIVEDVEKYFFNVAKLQDGMVMPRNIRHFNCPPLEVNENCVPDSVDFIG